jgi:hypothetical protein
MCLRAAALERSASSASSWRRLLAMMLALNGSMTVFLSGRRK